MELPFLLNALERARPAPARLIELPSDRPVVFVGDTHGDHEAVSCVLDRFPATGWTVVFLGDVVDRGPDSLGALELVLSATLARPDHVHLLMGNHEAWSIAPFSPADFWESLPPADAARLGGLLARLPFAAWHPAGTLAVHGALPDVEGLAAFASIEPGSEPWRAVTWGDWQDALWDGLPHVGSRPVFGRAEFERRMGRLGARILVRSHQPSAPTFLFDSRCLTLFTSSAYGDGRRRVAILRPKRSVKTARDLELVDL